MADDLTALLEAVREQGWRVEETKRGTIKAYSPDKVTIVTIHRTPSDRRWLDNTLRDLRSGGFDVGKFRGRRK